MSDSREMEVVEQFFSGREFCIGQKESGGHYVVCVGNVTLGWRSLSL